MIRHFRGTEKGRGLKPQARLYGTFAERWSCSWLTFCGFVRSVGRCFTKRFTRYKRAWLHRGGGVWARISLFHFRRDGGAFGIKSRQLNNSRDSFFLSIFLFLFRTYSTVVVFFFHFYTTGTFRIRTVTISNDDDDNNKNIVIVHYTDDIITGRAG